MSKSIKFSLPSLPASINALYLIDTSGRRRFASGKPRVVYMSEAGRKWAMNVSTSDHGHHDGPWSIPARLPSAAGS